MENTASKVWFLIVGALVQLVLIHAKQLCGGRDELILAQVMYRHGNRTIADTYKTDPLNDPKYFPEGFGVLTSAGKKVEKELGKYFRRRYASLLGGGCLTDKIYVRSYDLNRTIASAQYNLAGLLSSCGKKSSNECKRKQKIKIHTVPANKDNFLDLQLPCERADKLLDEYLHSNEIQGLLRKYSGLREYLETNSGSPANTLNDFYLFHDALSVEYELGLPLPEWARYVLKTQDNVMEYLHVLSFTSLTYSTELKKVKTGFLLREIFDRFKNKTLCRSKPDRVLWMYSTQDTTLIGVLNALGVFQTNEFPSYAASVLFELYRKGCEYFVQVFYRNDSSEYPQPLKIPKCGTKCSLDQLNKIYKNILPAENETFASLCRL